MRKLSEIKGEEAFCFLADILEAFSQIAADKEFVKIARSGDKMKMGEVLLRDHHDEILYIMAKLEDVEVEDYSPSVIEIMGNLLSMFNDKELISLFQFRDTVTSSGSATENTEATEQK